MSKAKKKLKYAVVQTEDVVQLCKECNQLLERGFALQGGASAVVDIKNQNTITYIQAFVYETNENS